MTHRTVRFEPDGVAVAVSAGSTLLAAATAAGIELRSACGGQGTCGQCAVRLLDRPAGTAPPGFPARLHRAGYVPACKTCVDEDLTVEIPASSRQVRHEVLLDDDEASMLAEEQVSLLLGYEHRPAALRRIVLLEPPSLEGNADDWSRLLSALRQQIPEATHRPVTTTVRALAELSATLRAHDMQVAVYILDLLAGFEVVRVLPVDQAPPPLGVAVDIGTTTVVVQLVDLEEPEVLARAGTHNRQSRYGDDVITRIIYAAEGPAQAEQLQEVVVGTINDLITQALATAGFARDDVLVAMVAGNTTMQHLFLGLPADQIRLEPYVPVATNYPVSRASELGLTAHASAAVIQLPAVASYVGGDVVAGMLAAGLADQEDLGLFVDIGTNGEMVLGNRDWLVACACSAGPCFEGGGITSGMRATNGAIQSITIDAESLATQVRTIGNSRPAGLCGSGLIDCLSALRQAGLIDRAGTFQGGGRACFREGDDGLEFVLIAGNASASGDDIVVTEADVKNLIRAKGAVFAGVRALLAAIEADMQSLVRVVVAGGFGSHLNIADAIRIGMLPDLPHERYRFMGNTSIKGARAALLSTQAYQRAQELASAITVIELSLGSMYMEEFVSALFLPHTDLSLFPSVQG